MSPLKPASCSMTDIDEIMVASPPRGGGATSININLFSDDQDPNFVDDAFLLRNLTLTTSSSSLGTRSIHRRKRPGDFYASGRSGTLLEDSDEEMFQSPRSSPNSYQTIDGRTVASKNPFSPYTPMDETITMSPIQMHLKTVPNFPVYIRQSNCKTVNLQQRSSPYEESYAEPSQNELYDSNPSSLVNARSHYMYPIPERSTQKIRRLHENDVTSVRRFNIDGLHVNTNLPHQFLEETSPTDVCNFPPATPMKKNRQSSSRFTMPETPGIDSRFRVRAIGNDDDSEFLEQSTLQEPCSRFALDFHVIGQLGNGSFGTVYKCLSRLDGCLYAVKETKRKAKGILDRDRMLKEVYALAALSDQTDPAAFHIVRYHQAWMEENRLYIQTELCSSTLDAEIKRRELSVDRRYKLLREILLALEFIHRNGMVHLDIKPENIFVKSDQYKLGDFGLASATQSKDDVEEGDSRYMSKELLAGDHKDLTKSDIFSLGVTAYELCGGSPLPMHGQEWHDIRGGILKPFSNTPTPMGMIIKEMMHPDPIERPQPKELLKKPELLSEDQKQLLAEKQKVLKVNMALALQNERIKKITPPRTRGLLRANTWTGSLPNNWM